MGATSLSVETTKTWTDSTEQSYAVPAGTYKLHLSCTGAAVKILTTTASSTNYFWIPQNQILTISGLGLSGETLYLNSTSGGILGILRETENIGGNEQ
jgi:hypothetical protein